MQAPSEIARLIVTAEGQSARVLEIGERLTIGRSASNSLVLDDQKASRHHAEIRCVGTRRYRLDDVGSANGTWLNGRRVSTPKDLRDGDQITIGGVRLKFIAPPEPQVSHSQSGVSGTALDIRNELVVVLVSDVRNYTSMSEALPSHESSELMTQWFRETAEIIEANGGTVDKFIGDAVMAYWVAAADSDAKKEVNAALSAARSLVHCAGRFSEKFSDKLSGYAFEIGVGLNVGPATLCNVGSAEHQSFTVVGDTVNVAFRLEPLSKTGDYRVIVSDEIAGRACDEHRFRKLGETEVKGRRQPVSTLGLVISADAGQSVGNATA